MLRLSDFVTLDFDQESNKNYLMDLEYGRLFHLNPSAFQLLSCIKEDGNYDQYVQKFAEVTNTAPELVKTDAANYVVSLLKMGYLIEV
ncbi:MAG TPA: PqqD family peptide modification chaperone [Mobilitalea sp.]|nr:PqqD family peptide modification chaperone [Mobilitalea sp.]